MRVSMVSAVLRSANRRAAQLGYALMSIAELDEAQQVPSPLLRQFQLVSSRVMPVSGLCRGD